MTTKRPDRIARALSSPEQALGYSALIVLLLCLPSILAAFGVPDHEQLLGTVDAPVADVAFIRHQLYGEDGPLDVVFLGSSMLGTAIETPRVQRALRAHLGREVAAITLTLEDRFEERFYILLSELLRRRPVRMVFFTVPARDRAGQEMSHEVHRWSSRVDTGTGLTGVLTGGERIALFGSHVLGAPRQLLYLLRPGLVAESQTADELGHWSLRAGFRGRPFEPFAPAPLRLAPREMIHPDDPSLVSFTGPPISSYQERFFREITRMLRERGVGFALVHMPRWPERQERTLQHLVDWSVVARQRIAIVGVPSAKLFARMDDRQIRKLYYDRWHFNANGATFYTATILPALLEIFDTHAG